MKEHTVKILIGGHRGLGMTDSAFAQKRNTGDGIARPPENTLESLLGALRAGADFIETDAIRTKDGEIVLTHSDDPSTHIIVPQGGVPGKQFIDEMTLEEVQSLHTGLTGEGRIASLRELLRAIETEFPGDGMVLNLELKGMQATNRPTADAPSLVRPVLEAIREENFPLERILFSSFSVKALEELAALEPIARMGLLFYTAPPGASFADTVLFGDGSELYIPFKVEDISAALKRLPSLSVVAPEIQDLTEETVAFAAKNNLSIATYGYPEESPLKSDRFGPATKEAVRLCREHDVALGVITDFIDDMRAATREIMPQPAPKKAAALRF
jgi:glycerophosphoryl diester phosphodiesterase